MQTTSDNLNKTVRAHPDYLEKNRARWIVDAKGKTLGRLAVDIANKLMGKGKAHTCDMWDCGDYVVVINAAHIRTTGNKLEDKIYYRHSGYKGHLKETTLGHMLAKHPDRAITLAVKGMLPKNKLRKHRLKRLKVSANESHAYGHFPLQPMDANSAPQKSQQQQQQ